MLAREHKYRQLVKEAASSLIHRADECLIYKQNPGDPEVRISSNCLVSFSRRFEEFSPFFFFCRRLFYLFPFLHVIMLGTNGPKSIPHAGAGPG